MLSKWPTIAFLGLMIVVLLLIPQVARPQLQRNLQVPGVETRQAKISLRAIAPAYEYGRFSFMDISLLKSGEVWAVGYDGQDPQRMWHSADGGDTWEVKPAPTGGFTLHKIFFADQQHGWAVGRQKIFIRTSNGGKTWEQARLPIWMDWNQIHFVTPSVGYVAGSTGACDRKTGNCTHGIKVLRTTDGGLHWRACYQDDSSYNIHSIATPTKEVAIIAVDGSSLLRTENGGQSWRVAGPPTPGASSVKFNPDGRGWVVGPRGSFYFSTDQGKTWQRPTGFPQSLSNCYWWDLDFADQRIGIAVGDHSALALTSDGGATWAEYPLNVDDHLRVVRLQGRSGLVIGSKSLYRLTISD